MEKLRLSSQQFLAGIHLFRPLPHFGEGKRRKSKMDSR